MKPLAYRMRPANIEDIIGQEHLVKEDKIIGRMVRAKHLSSMILYGPPGIGKRPSPQRSQDRQASHSGN